MTMREPEKETETGEEEENELLRLPRRCLI